MYLTKSTSGLKQDYTGHSCCTYYDRSRLSRIRLQVHLTQPLRRKYWQALGNPIITDWLFYAAGDLAPWRHHNGYPLADVIDDGNGLPNRQKKPTYSTRLAHRAWRDLQDQTKVPIKHLTRTKLTGWPEKGVPPQICGFFFVLVCLVLANTL